jgi:glycosyltransferase involved in cell wall biosynthesis
MRIALIDPSLFTLPYDAALAAGLGARGHEAVLYGRTPDPGETPPPGLRLLPGFYRFAERRAVRALPGALRLGVKGADHLRSMLWLRRALAAWRPDVLHFQWLPLPALDRRFLPGLRRLAPLVLTVHDTNPFNGDPSTALQGVGTARAWNAFDRLIVHTARGRERLVGGGADPARGAVLPHGPLGQPAAAAGSAASADAMDGPVTFLLFGKFKPYKGIDLLIEAFSRVPEPLRARARLRVVGKPYMDLGPLRALAAARGVDPGLEPRFVPDEEVPALFGPGTVAVFPYREIEASGVLTFAVGHGRPIIASRIGGFAETLADGVHGALLEPGDAGALAAAMTRMLADRDWAAACARNVAALAAAAPDWPAIADATVALYGAARGAWAAPARSAPNRRAPPASRPAAGGRENTPA